MAQLAAGKTRLAGDPGGHAELAYAVDGSRNLPERVLSHLGGHEDSRPGGLGSATSGRAGPAPDGRPGRGDGCLGPARQQGLEDSPESWALQLALLRNSATTGRSRTTAVGVPQPAAVLHPLAGHGVGGLRSRAIKAVEQQWLQGPVPEVARAAEQGVRRGDGGRGYSEERGQLHPALRHDRGGCLAAAPAYRPSGSSPADDPRFLGTVRTVERELLRDGLVLRCYRTEAGLDRSARR